MGSTSSRALRERMHSAVGGELCGWRSSKEEEKGLRPLQGQQKAGTSVCTDRRGAINSAPGGIATSALSACNASLLGLWYGQFSR